jgi:hypothetical protein
MAYQLINALQKEAIRLGLHIERRGAEMQASGARSMFPKT